MEAHLKPLHQRPDFPNYRTNRTSNGGRVIYSCGKEWVEAIGFLLAEFLSVHKLELYAGCFFFTHDHLDLGHPAADSAEEVPRFSAFFEDFHWWVFWLLKQNGWEHGPVYNPLERTYQGPSLDSDQIWWDLVYDTSQAVTAGFVRRSKHYVGLCFQPEDVLKPRRFRRNRLIDRIDPDRKRFPREVASIQLGVPRPFQHLSREEYAEEFRRRLDEYEDSVANPRAKTVWQAAADCRRRTIGKVLRTNGESRPNRVRSTLRPQPVNSTRNELKRAYRKQRREFWQEHRSSYESLQEDSHDVKFPPGTYLWRRKLKLGCSRAQTGCWEEFYPD